MGIQKKLARAYQEGYEAGQMAANETAIKMAMNNGMRIGIQQTWDNVEAMIPELEGIGPKTTEKILKAVQDYARKEYEKLNI